MDFTAGTSADIVAESFDGAEPRMRQLMQGLVRHLHAYVKEVEPTMDEWMAAIAFLTETGQACTDTRQEFILLSDLLGVSMLVETLNGTDAHAGGAGTASTVLGPFHMTESPRREFGDALYPDRADTLIEGQVTDPAGEPVAGAVIDVWQADDEGFYDVARPEPGARGTGRGLFTTGADGRFSFRTVLPDDYPVPTDGPAGRMLLAAKRPYYRPAHIHFLVRAAGYRTLTTHFFVEGSPNLGTDPVFAVKQSLVRTFEKVDENADDAVGTKWSATCDIVLTTD